MVTDRQARDEMSESDVFNNESGQTANTAQKLRSVHFPEDFSLGGLYAIYRTGNMSGWWEDKLGEARGTVEVVADCNLHILVNPRADLRAFNRLGANDIQSLDFRLCDINDNDLETISHLTGLRYLALSERHITDAGLASLRNLLYLHTLDLGGTLVSDYGLARLKHLGDLRKLYVDSTHVSGAGAAELNVAIPQCHIVVHSGRIITFPFERSPGKILVAQSDQDGQRSWREIGEAIGSVQVSRRAFVRLEVSDREAFHQCEKLKPDDIQSLDFLFDEISRDDFAIINRLSGLRELRLGGLELEKNSLHDLVHLQRLRTLQLTSCNIMGRETLKPLQRIATLKELRLSHCQFTDVNLGELLTNTRAKKVLLEGAHVDDTLLKTVETDNEIGEFYLVFSSVTDEGMVALRHFPKLTTLVLRTDNITAEGLENVLNLTDLTRLVIRCDEVSEEVFASFRYLKRLEELSLRQLDLKGEGLEYLGELTSLKRLYLGASADATKADFDRYKTRIRMHIGNLPNLEELSLRYDGAEIEFGDLPRLKVLDLSNNPVTDGGLQGLGSLQNLETLHLKGANRIGLDTMQKIANLVHLKELDVSLTRINNEGISHLKSLHNLRFLNISSTACDNGCLPYLSELKDLRFIEFPRALQDDDLQHIAGLVRLRNLRLGTVTDTGMAELTNLSMVREVNLASQEITDNTLSYIRNFTHLKDLNLSNTLITDAGMVYLTNFKELTTLNLSGTVISDDGASALSNLVGLRSLDLENCKRLRDRGISCISNLTSLRWLNLSNTRASDTGLSSIRRLPHLNTLRLSFTHITDDGLSVLSQLHDLNVLDLENLEISGTGLRHIVACRRLKELKLSSSTISDESLANLAELPALEELDLRNTPITNGALEQLAKIKSLKKLTLIGTNIAFPDLVELSPLENLETLYFHECDISRVERAGVKMALPNCRFVYLDKDVNWS